MSLQNAHVRLLPVLCAPMKSRNRAEEKMPCLLVPAVFGITELKISCRRGLSLASSELLEQPVPEHKNGRSYGMLLCHFKGTTGLVTFIGVPRQISFACDM